MRLDSTAAQSGRPMADVKNESCSFPDMKMIGRKAATVVSVLRVMASATSDAPFRAASNGRSPISRCR